MLNNLLKLLFVFAILPLLIGNNCEKNDAEENSKKTIEEEKADTENPEDEFYDGLDDALAELDEIEDI